MEVRDDGKTNPLIIVSREEVSAWLRAKADEAGYADREMSAVQISVEHPFEGGKTYHLECPQLVAMVSNIKTSRGTAPTKDDPDRHIEAIRMALHTAKALECPALQVRTEELTALMTSFDRVLAAAKLYEEWARKTGDYPHDEHGCIAHAAIIEAVTALKPSETP